MKFIHMADMHFDTTFSLLSTKENLGEKRRLDQREVFTKIIEYIKENNIPYLFISGDFYEQKYIRETTIKFINDKFKEIPNTKIYIAPGNHDPLLKNSYYNTYNWNENVHIFGNEVEKISTPEADIYGFGFNDFYLENFNIEDLKIQNKEKINILIMHASLDASSKLEMQYNPIQTKKLQEKGFDYIALGHIHKNNFNKNSNIIYPGSTISLGFDELGKHGVILGEIDKNTLKIDFISMDNKEFVEYELDVTEINSKEELIEKLNSLEIPKEHLYKILLTGQRNFEININSILKIIENNNILKIKDFSKNKYNLEEISKEKTLKGIFVKKLLEKQEEGIYNKEKIEKALELGLDIL